MNKWFSVGFWETIARIILRNRIFFLCLIVLITIIMGFQWNKMRFSFTEANLLPNDRIENIEYNEFLKKFGEEGNLVVIGFNDSTFFTEKNYNLWIEMMISLQNDNAVELVVDINNLKVLQKNESLKKFELKPFINPNKISDSYLLEKKKELFNDLPFYEGTLFSKKNGSIRAAVYIKKDIINTIERRNFIVERLIPAINTFEKKSKIDLRVSGMPYIRTLNSQNIIDEISLFVLAALLVTSILFFTFFRSYRATFISMLIVIIGVMWVFGTIGLFNYEITVLTGIIPPLIIVIGIPNCIFLINKYQQEIKNHGNQARSLQRVISKVGNATLFTNVTTAAGFATFIFTDSQLLKEFGIVASLNIIFLFLISVIVIPIIYSFMAMPNEKHLKHLNNEILLRYITKLENFIKHKQISIYITAVVLLVIGIIGIFQIKSSGSIISEMAKKTDFFKDILFYEKEFNGVMPLEILIDTKKRKGVMKLSTLKKIEDLQETIREIPELSTPVSVANLVKYSKQAYYNNNPEYYELPTSQEQAFILAYAKNSVSGKGNLMNAYVDKTGQYARITTYIKDIGTDEMHKVEEKLNDKIARIFPKEKFKVSMTGKAYLFQKGTEYLINNLIFSLIFAILLISLLMAYLFRSFKMILISLVPNLLPLIITAGLMGYFGIPLKPSTILVFSIAFGISVDDTIHFLAKYRQELKANHWKIRKSVYATVREAGVSMFYTSIVLFFGFSVFTLSSFGGTVALGALIATTLLFAMLSNLILLPTLLLSLEKNIANEKEFKEPSIDILSEEEKN